MERTYVARKFYCGARDILISNLAKETLDDAIEAAGKTLTDDPKRDYVVVVQIVRIVRRAEAPIRVEIVE